MTFCYLVPARAVRYSRLISFILGMWRAVSLMSISDFYRYPVRVHLNGTTKKSSIRVGFQVLVRSRTRADPNGTLTFL